MMVRLPSSSILKNSKLRLVVLALSGLFGLLFAFNLWQFRTQSLGGAYLPSQISLVQVPQEARVNQPFTVTWEITAPTPRDAGQTALFWGSESTRSATFSSTNDTPYPQKSLDYWSGPFRLPDSFQVRLTPSRPGYLYFRAYALVDNRPLWSEERKILVKP